MIEGTCSACGRPGHRFGTTHGPNAPDRWDPIACINGLTSEIGRLQADRDALASKLRMVRSALKSKIIGFESLGRGIDGVLADHADPPPSLDSLLGAIPDITGGMDSVDYVRQQRE